VPLLELARHWRQLSVELRAQLKAHLEEISRMLAGLINGLENRRPQPQGSRPGAPSNISCARRPSARHGLFVTCHRRKVLAEMPDNSDMKNPVISSRGGKH